MQKTQILATGELSISVLRTLAALFFQMTRVLFQHPCLVAHSFRRSAVFQHLWALHTCPCPHLHKRLQNSGQQTHTKGFQPYIKNVKKEYARVYALKTLRVLSVGRDLPLLSVKTGWSLRPHVVHASPERLPWLYNSFIICWSGWQNLETLSVHH